jgi:pilus assembly protein FimV
MPQKPDAPAGRSPPDSAAGSGLDEPTANEVRIKLDLALQYLDMGDPESARQMLEEVLKEGDSAQRQEAGRLMDSLP